MTSGIWLPGNSGLSPGSENAFMARYIAGDLTDVEGKA